MLGREFHTYLKAERNYSIHTIQAYTHDLEGFHQFVSNAYEFDLFQRSEVDLVTHRMIRSWMGELLDSGLSKRSIARKLASLNAYFQFLRKKSLLEQNPAAKVKVPKFEKKLPAFLKDASVEVLFEHLEYPETVEGQRDRALLELLYSCGLRRSEIIGLRYGNIDWANQTLKVMGKGRKERIVPFGDHARAALRTYMLACDAESLSYRAHFFIRKDGQPLYPQLVYRVVNRYLQQASTLSKTSPHVLRHTFATHLLDRGADLNAIKELLGHSSLAATQVYVHNSISKLKDTHRKAHPKA
ncbi:MAG: tyrosine-type recombinase/integrase [Bacteroidota bacterium]